MDEAALREQVVAVLRAAGARFAYIFGSRVEGNARPGSDVDVAASFGDRSVDPIAVLARLPGTVDLVILESVSLEVAGRVATRGRVLFDDDPPGRVAWESITRTMWFDERPRMEQARRDFADGARARARGRS